MPHNKVFGSIMKRFIWLEEIFLKSPLLACLVLSVVILSVATLVSNFAPSLMAWLFVVSVVLMPAFIWQSIGSKHGIDYIVFISILIFGSFLLIDEPAGSSAGFQTVSQAAAHAQYLVERNIEMENKNFLKPSYLNYYKSLRSGFLSSRVNAIRAALFMPSSAAWDTNNFVDLLSQVNKVRIAKYPSSDFVQKISTNAETKIAVFGDIQGAFTSMARNFEEMKRIGFMDDDFKLTSSNNYIFFMGDAVSRSPFQLELLSLLLKVMQVNPDNVFYMKGNHESQNYWHGFGLKEELQSRFGHKSKEQIPHGDALNQLFHSLPLAVYAVLPNNEFIRLAHFGGSINPLMLPDSENKLFKFLTQASKEQIIAFDDVKEEVPAGQLNIKAILKAEKKRDTYQDMDGLRLLPPENGRTAWTIISCPTEVYRKGLKFFYDTFAMLQPIQGQAGWKVVLHKQDMRTKSGFETREQDLFTGLAVGESLAAPTSSVSFVPAAPLATQPAPIAAPASQMATSSSVQVVAAQPGVVTPQAQPVMVVQQPQASAAVQQVPAQMVQAVPQQVVTVPVPVQQMPIQAGQVQLQAQPVADPGVITFKPKPAEQPVAPVVQQQVQMPIVTPAST